MSSSAKPISLVLGSGGARGYAHIGVIEELTAHGYQIVSVSGSSMGALIGGLYACGELESFKRWVLELDIFDVAKLVDVSFAGTGIIGGEKVFGVIEEMVGARTIESLPIAYTAVATDLMRQKEVWLRHGALIDAIRASIAIPSVFTPKRIGDRVLVDGGVLNPLPIAPTMADNTDTTVAVNLGANVPKRYHIDVPETAIEKAGKIKGIVQEMVRKAEKLFAREKPDSFEEMDMFDIMGRTIDTMQNAIMESKMAGYAPDILIDIPNDACGFYEFHRAYEMIELGRRIARDTLASLHTEVS